MALFRRVKPAFTPRKLSKYFSNYFWGEPSLSPLNIWKDAAGTTPVTVATDVVGKLVDSSGLGNHATQSTAGNQPTYNVDARGTPVLRHDSDDKLTLTAASTFGSAASVYYANQWGVQQSHGVNVGTSYDLPGKPAANSDDVYGWIVTPTRPNTGVENQIIKYFEKKGGPYALWTPAVATTSLWFDAADMSSFTFSSGTTISQWNDKSGGGLHATQSNNGYRPALSGGVVFDGSDDHLLIGDYLDSQIAASHTVYAVAKYTAQALISSLLTKMGDSSNGTLKGSWAFTVSASSTRYVRLATSYTTDNQNLTVTGAGYIPDNTTFIARVSYDSSVGTAGSTANSAIRTDFSIDGTSTADSVYYSAGVFGSIPNSTSRLAIGAQVGEEGQTVSHYLNGTIYELLFFPAKHDAQTVAVVEGYLAHKWGLTANLPAAHPFKNNAPKYKT